jgi:cellulose synthase/poly-beta-1,6-N-acetylglucosamine synthase-like glycosyltransferase
MIQVILAYLYLLVSLLLLPFGYNCLYMVYCSLKYTSKKADPLDSFPIVTVQLPIYNEKYVVKRLVKSVTAMRWPRDKMQIQILDDSTDETSDIIEGIITDLGGYGLEIQVLKRSDRTGFKAGALQNALEAAEGEYLIILDADFMPPPDYIQTTIPLLESDPELGIVQTRWGHINRRYNWLTQAFALGIDGHHMVEQTGRSAEGLLLNFNGSCGVLRKKAIVDAGGWSSDTLSEDMDLSYRMQLKGWKVTYMKDVVVPGEVPPTITAFRSQQSRWAKGSIQCSKKLLGRVWKSKLFSTLQKIQATFHLSYYTIHPLMLSALILSVPLLAIDAFKFIPYWPPYLLLFSLCTISSFTMYMTSISRQKLTLKEVPYLGLLSLIGYGLSARCSFAVISGLLQSRGFFHRTPKYDIKTAEDDWRTRLYRPAANLGLVEVSFMLYSLIGIYFATIHRVWSMVFYLSVFFFGYLTIVYYMFRS